MGRDWRQGRRRVASRETKARMDGEERTSEEASEIEKRTRGKKSGERFFGERGEGGQKRRRDRGEQREKDKKRQRQVRYFQGNGGEKNFTFAKVSLCTFRSRLPGRLQRCLLFVIGLGGIGKADETPPGSLRRTAPLNASESSR